ncbi:hypothetical protein BDY19DRAFT_231911 [Irpex rosettiformis]|uniref:Uncharacterized protein n=1 Tax=Irpex rosettiformis TaxID=378272 RepID=A0ACB8U066_9APHY|nr:hypothetical protein BDY19DRAFT_231911 [Irpex rosettiformis]
MINMCTPGYAATYKKLVSDVLSVCTSLAYRYESTMNYTGGCDHGGSPLCPLQDMINTPTRRCSTPLLNTGSRFCFTVSVHRKSGLWYQLSHRRILTHTSFKLQACPNDHGYLYAPYYFILPGGIIIPVVLALYSHQFCFISSCSQVMLNSLRCMRVVAGIFSRTYEGANLISAPVFNNAHLVQFARGNFSL